MALASDVKVARVLEDSLLAVDGTVQRRVRVEFMVGTFGPFTVIVPRAEFSAERVNAEIEKVAAPLRALK